MNLAKRASRILSDEKGSAIVLLTLAMTAMIGSAALVADVGVNYLKQARLSVAADAAALAGGRKLSMGNEFARQAAIEYAWKNGVSEEDLVVSVDGNGRGITVKARGPVKVLLGKLFGISGGRMEQEARVATTRPIAFWDVFPLGADHRQLAITTGVELDLFNQVLGGPGNWGALQFDGSTGASDLRAYLKNGYPGLVSIGDLAEFKKGANESAIRDGTKDRWDAAAADHQCVLGECPAGCPRVLILPIYETLSETNQDKKIRVLDFAAFWISRIVGQGSNRRVYGYFLNSVGGRSISIEGESPYGMTTIKLVK